MKQTILITFRLGVPASLTQTPNRRAHVKKNIRARRLGISCQGVGTLREAQMLLKRRTFGKRTNCCCALQKIHHHKSPGVV